MIVINDQLKHHLQNWDEDSVCESEGKGGDKNTGTEKEVTKQKELSGALCPIPQLSDDFWEILFCGFLLGLASSRFPFDILSLLLSLIICGKTICVIREWRTNEQSRIAQTQREKLSIQLARLGASPLLSANCHHLPTKIEFVGSVEDFLITIDYALERLQSATSLKIGLGIWSPSVHRVEHRRLSLLSRKRNLGQALQQCLSLLKHKVDMPSVVTVAWLMYARKQVDVLIVPYLDSIERANDLKRCCLLLKELNAYIHASFLQSELRDDSLNPVAQHLHAAQIALWAHCEDDDQAYKEEWIKHFCSLVTVSSTLQKSLVPQTDSDPRAVNIVSSELQPAKPEDLQSYEHQGTDVPIDPVQQKGIQTGNTTLVFSGEGSVARRRREIPVVLTTTPPSTVTQAVLFRELQSRLSTLEPAVEVDVTVNEQIHANDEHPKQEIISSQAFPVSDNLLSELKFTLNSLRP